MGHKSFSAELTEAAIRADGIRKLKTSGRQAEIYNTTADAYRQGVEDAARAVAGEPLS